MISYQLDQLRGLYLSVSNTLPVLGNLAIELPKDHFKLTNSNMIYSPHFNNVTRSQVFKIRYPRNKEKAFKTELIRKNHPLSITKYTPPLRINGGSTLKPLPIMLIEPPTSLTDTRLYRMKPGR